MGSSVTANILITLAIVSCCVKRFYRKKLSSCKCCKSRVTERYDEEEEENVSRTKFRCCFRCCYRNANVSKDGSQDIEMKSKRKFHVELPAEIIHTHMMEENEVYESVV